MVLKSPDNRNASQRGLVEMSLRGPISEAGWPDGCMEQISSHLRTCVKYPRMPL